MSIKYKIVMLFVALVTLIVAVGSLMVYFFSVKERQDAFRTRLKNRALITAKVYDGIKDSNYVVLRRMNTAAVASLYDKSIAIVGYNNAYDFMFADNAADSLYITDDIIKKVKTATLLPYRFSEKQAWFWVGPYLNKAHPFTS